MNVSREAVPALDPAVIGTVRADQSVLAVTCGQVLIDVFLLDAR